MIVCWRSSCHSADVERAGLVEDLLGDRDLADVVELGRADHDVELLARQPQPHRHPARQRRRRCRGAREGARRARRAGSCRTSRVWRESEGRELRLFAYMRWSASRSASEGSLASSGRRTAPCELEIAKPSPWSSSARTARSTTRSSSRLEQHAELVAAQAVGAAVVGRPRAPAGGRGASAACRRPRARSGRCSA